MARQMIKGVTMLLLIAALSLVTAVVSANGQSSRKLVATIPFDFVVGSRELPAGKYGVEPVSTGSEALKIAGTDNAKSVMRLSNAITSTRPTEKGKMVFHRYGNQYFLAEVWRPGESQGRQLLKSAGEKAIQRELAANQTRSEQNYERVEIALVRR